MKNNNSRTMLILPMMLILASCSTTRYASQPATSNFIVDGDRTEWAGRFKSPKDEAFAIGAAYDENYIYLAVVSMDQSFQRLIMMNGFTLWLDAGGGKKEDLGVVSKGQKDFRGRGPQERNFREPGDRDAALQQLLNAAPGNVELTVIEGGSERLGPSDLLCSSAINEGELFLELQIPVTLLGTAPAELNELGLGLISEMQMSRPSGRPGGGPPGGMRGGGMSGGGMQGGRSGRQGRPTGMPSSQKINFWIVMDFSDE